MANQQSEREFKFQDTSATQKIFNLSKRIRAVYGGTGASKTISIMVWLIDYAQTTRNKIIDVISESFPHLEGGAIQDFKDIMMDRGYWEAKRWNESKHFYVFPGGTKLRFTSMDKLGKAHGPRRDILYLNECNNIAYEIARQLMLRTREIIWLDWNPSHDFWYYEEIQGKRDDVEELKLTFLDNEALDENTKNEILTLKTNQYLWSVYGLGELMEPEGKIYTGWQFVDEIPKEAELLRHWLDFGYTNDPTAIGDLYYLNGMYYLDEQAYLKGLSNKSIADIINNLKKALTVADSAEPKSIDELMMYGVNVIPSPKGPGSVNQQIAVVQGEMIAVTKRSVNIIKEYRNWTWMKDPKTGRIINEPIDLFDHHMKGIGYAMATLAPMLRRKALEDMMPTYQERERPNPAR